MWGEAMWRQCSEIKGRTLTMLHYGPKEALAWRNPRSGVCKACFPTYICRIS